MTVVDAGAPGGSWTRMRAGVVAALLLPALLLGGCGHSDADLAARYHVDVIAFLSSSVHLGDIPKLLDVVSTVPEARANAPGGSVVTSMDVVSVNGESGEGPKALGIKLRPNTAPVVREGIADVLRRHGGVSRVFVAST